MANRLENEWTDGDVLDAADLNDTFEATPPIGSIVAWHKDLTNTPTLPDGWAECNGQTISNTNSPYDGQTLPDLNGNNRFLRGSSTTGGTGGASSTSISDSHFHTDAVYNAGSGWSMAPSTPDEGRTDERSWSKNFTNEPPYFDVVWVIRIA